MRPSWVGKYVAHGDAMAWMFTLSLVVVAGPTQPPPSRIGPVSPLIHSVSNPPAVDKGVGSIGRWGRGGYEFSGGALHLWTTPGFLCAGISSGHDRFVGAQVPGHGYRLANPSRIRLWVVEQQFAAQFGVRQGREGGHLILGRGWVGSGLAKRNPETGLSWMSSPSHVPLFASSCDCRSILAQTSYVHPSLLRI